MITCYFGVPRVGKTTLLTKFAINELKRIRKGKSKYLHVYTNFSCKGCEKIDFSDLSKYKFSYSLVILDEITIDADNRAFKTFPPGARDLFILHGHLCMDIIYATQAYDMVDLKIRRLTQDLWYMSRTVVPFLSEFTFARRIYRNININEHTSELIMGYRFCNFLEALFVSNTKLVFRRFYYKYFDSFEESVLSDRQEFSSELWSEPLPDNILVDKLKLSVIEPIKSFYHRKQEEQAELDEVIEQASELQNDNPDKFYDLYIDDE